MMTGKYIRTPNMMTGRYVRTIAIKYKLTSEQREKRSKWHLKNGRKGKDCNFWKGGISRNYKRGYFSSQFKNWRRDVFIRDEFTCQECGQKHIYITAHHIKSFAKYPKLRYVVENGKTLCEDCHKLTDNYKGRGGRK